MDFFRHFFGPTRDRDGGPNEDFDHSWLHRHFEGEMGRIFGLFSGSEVPVEDAGEEPRGALREQFLRRGYEKDDRKIDTDLDKKVQTGNLDLILELPSTTRTFVTGFSETVRTVTKPDGSIETERTSKDSEGNEESTTCRLIGDKEYCVIRKRTKDGREEISERLVNMTVEEKEKLLSDDTSVGNGHNSRFPFDKFFR